MKIKELPMDQKTTITLLLTSIEEKETRNSSPYCTLTLTDGIDTIIAQLWNKGTGKNIDICRNL